MMHAENNLAFRLAIIASILALIVVMLGAYTRLKDAGLGCPDWPGCYGQIVVPETPHAVLLATEEFPKAKIEPAKAWREMIHRYAAGTLGLLIFIIALLTLARRRLPNQPIGLPLGLIALVIFQALLGKWTVTMLLLPLVVMSHLLGGITILALLWLLMMRLGGFFANAGIDNTLKAFRPWAWLGLIILVIQIFLGGWTSANYAALVCPDFPFCQGKLWPAMNFPVAFHFWMSIGPNFEGGVLDTTARVTIHVMHRLGGLITLLYFGWLSLWLLLATRVTVLKKIAGIILLLLILQIIFGILNVVLLLPLPIAVAHNGTAALLLLSVVTLLYGLHKTTTNGNW